MPGFGLPGLAPGVTLSTPSSTPIIPGGPSWSPLGGYSGRCYDTGCGYTGWIGMNYLIAAAGNYALKFGVVDNIDQIWDSGMAFDGIQIGGVPIDDDEWHPGARIAGPVGHRPGRPRRHAPPQDGRIDSSRQQKAFVLQSSRSCCTASSMPRLVVFYSLWSLKTDARIHQMVENAYKTTLACAFVSLVAGLYRKRALSVGNFYNRR